MTPQKRENRIIFICWLAYAAAYVGRLNYSASIVAIVADMGVTKAQAGLVASMFFFAYGTGQLVNGILSKRYNSRIMVFFSLFVSSLLNLAMPLSGSISAMKYIWLANGAVQSILWSTLIKTISENVSDGKISKAIVVMSTPVAAGTLPAYALSSLFVKYSTWKTTFYVSAAVLLAVSIVWFVLYGSEKTPAKEAAVSSASRSKKGLSKAFLLCIITIAFAGIANGFTKDGINTWVSSVLYEEFGISQSFSIMLTLLLPLVSLAGASLVAAIHKKVRIMSDMDSAFFALAALACFGVLISLRHRSIVPLMICFVLVACLMSMANNVITSVFPLESRNKLGSGFLAGFLNTFCYVGSTLTSYSLGKVSQQSGWNAVFIIMLAVCGAAAVASLIGSITERKENNNDNSN